MIQILIPDYPTGNSRRANWFRVVAQFEKIRTVVYTGVIPNGTAFQA